MFPEIIDTHCHIYPEKIADKAVQAISDFYSIPMSHDGLVRSLKSSGAKIGVTKYVVHSLATTAHQVSRINDFILSCTRSDGDLIGFATLQQDLSEQEMREEMDRVLPEMKGVKLHPDFQRFNVDDEEVFKIYRAIDGRVPILFHAGDKRYSYSAPERIARVAQLFPKQQIIAAHFGGYQCWERGDVYAGLDNVWFDTCSSLEYLDPKEAVGLIRRLGAEKFLFASDFPMWDHEEELARFMRLPLTDREREMILGANAKRLLGLK